MMCDLHFVVVALLSSSCMRFQMRGSDIADQDVGVVCNCAMCDSYFVVVVMQVDYSNYRGGAG